MKDELAKFGEMVPVTEGEFCVDARHLWKAMSVGRDFSNWIKGRIEKYGFQEGTDFEKSSMISGSPILASSKRQPRIDYHLTLDMAKQLAMVENNEAGLIARRYFIACEKQLHKQQAIGFPKHYKEALKALKESVEKQIELLEQNEQKEAQIQTYQTRLGEHPVYHKVSEDEWITKNIDSRVFGTVGSIMKQLSEELNAPILDTPHPVVGSVGVYRNDVFEAFRKKCENEPEFLAEWRIYNAEQDNPE